MNLQIFPSLCSGSVWAPPSKSMAHRLLICAALAQGKSVIEPVDRSEDLSATCDCLRSLGATVEWEGRVVTVTGCGGAPTVRDLLPCRESGSTLRFLIPLCLLGGGGTLMGSSRLMERPLWVYEDLFSQRGILLERRPHSLSVEGRLSAGVFRVPGDVSSQFITGLLFALPLLDGDSRIECTTPLESASYLLLTLSALRRFGVRVIREGEGSFFIPGNQTYTSARVTVEGDESNAAFFGALNSVAGPVSVLGRDPETLQGDRVWEAQFAALRKGYCAVSVRDCPDLAPILMTVAALESGCTLTDTGRLKLKESDRGVAMQRELAKFGADVSVEDSTIVVRPSTLHPPKEPLCGWNDHRVVMCMAVLCAKYGGVIQGAEAVNKSFPGFFEALKTVKVRMKTV